MPTKGKLEARIRVPSGWEVTASGTPVEIPAGDYYLSSGVGAFSGLLEAFATELSTETGDTWTAAIDGGEGGTGRVTITADTSSTLVWGSDGASLQDLLGFSGDLASGTSWVGALHARSIWLPNCPYVTHVGGQYEGMVETDAVWQESGAGDVFGWSGQKKKALSVRWDAITAARCWECQEALGNESFERFFLDVIFGEADWAASPGGPIRFHRDADDDATYTAFKSTGTKDLNLPVFGEAAGLLYRVELPRLVKLPRDEDQP